MTRKYCRKTDLALDDITIFIKTFSELTRFYHTNLKQHPGTVDPLISISNILDVQNKVNESILNLFNAMLPYYDKENITE
jgi:hypothetical protein